MGKLDNQLQKEIDRLNRIFECLDLHYGVTRFVLIIHPNTLEELYNEFNEDFKLNMLYL